MFKRINKTKHFSAPFSALTTSRVIAHKRSGDVFVYLTQSDNAFFLSFGEIVNGKNGSYFKLIAEKTLTAAQAHEVLCTVFKTSHSAAQECSQTEDVLFLEIPKIKVSYAAPKNVRPTTSPYFPSKEIFLSHQMTGAPNSLK